MAAHSFHIPVLGVSYSIDTPVKVARFGISSVISIMDDELLEKMRQYHCRNNAIAYEAIDTHTTDYRAARITAYLNTIQDIVDKQVAAMRHMSFTEDNDLVKYFELLPSSSALKQQYFAMRSMPEGTTRNALQLQLRQSIQQGAIDVNIMAKVDKTNTDIDGNALPAEYSDALSALRGFANSRLQSSLVLSAGYNPRLYNYIEQFSDFYPDDKGHLQKKLILKVSDYRSALVQGKILAKKGLWVSEYRIESGLNCGGHAFATDGVLLGVILEEFKNKRDALADEIFTLCNATNMAKGRHVFTTQPPIKITAQGGIGTAGEDHFLLEHYKLDGTGWGSPFLLVPEATNVENTTLHKLATAKPGDYYMSYASPLGVPFNNFRTSSSEEQRIERIRKQRPGSPCYKKYLVSNTEFTPEPICTASRLYQHLKLKQLQTQQLEETEYDAAVTSIIEKDCLCEGLVSSVLLKDELPLSHNLQAVTICPGPNLAYFSGVHTLTEMVGHIYGRLNILNNSYRPNMFINELNLYVDYFKKQLDKAFDIKQQKYLQLFKSNLTEGISYYKRIAGETIQYLANMKSELEKIENTLNQIMLPVAVVN